LGAGLGVWVLALTGFVAAGRPDALDNPAGVAYPSVAAAAYAAMAAVLLVRLRRLFSAPGGGLALRPLTWPDFRACLSGIAVVLLLRLGTFVYLAAIGQAGHVQTGLGAFNATDRLGAALTIAVGTTIGPFSEELLYRGTIYRVLSAYMPLNRATFLSALIFAAARFDLVLFPFFTAYGVVLAVLYRRTHNLFVPIAVRAAFDGGSYALLVWLDAASP
jgi:membrane protease YdiL (CAAX protease family)